MTDLLTDARRGELAREVLENEVYSGAYALIEQEITKSWRESKSPTEREELHRALRTLVKVQRLMESTMDSGKVALKSLEIERSRLQRIGGVFKRD